MRTRAAIVGVAVLLVGVAVGVTPATATPHSVDVLTTVPNGSARLATSSVTLQNGTSPQSVTIAVGGQNGPQAAYQSITGFGASFTDSSAWLIDERLTTQQREQLITDLFDPVDGIGITVLRQPMGATDFNAPTSGFYTYDDRVCTDPDPQLTSFSTAHDDAYILPILREARAAASDLTVMATPWSPPAWMRNGACSTLGTIGGSFKEEYFAAYAQYFVRFLQDYAAKGVPVDYVTPQNEPTNELILLPSMNFPVAQEITFVRDYLSPALAQAGLSTQILGWDYVWDQAPVYPTQLMSDSSVLPHLAGTAWHCYGGVPADMAPIHYLAPSKEIHVTECSGLYTLNDQDQFKKTMNMFVDSTRNWASSVVLWNIALDSTNGPNSGCSICRPLVHIDYSLTEGWVVSKQIEYYALGQVSKWVRPGAVRVSSTTSATGINNVAFINPDGSKVLVTINNSTSTQTFGVQDGNRWFEAALPAGAAATFRWTN